MCRHDRLSLFQHMFHYVIQNYSHIAQSLVPLGGRNMHRWLKKSLYFGAFLGISWPSMKPAGTGSTWLMPFVDRLQRPGRLTNICTGVEPGRWPLPTFPSHTFCGDYFMGHPHPKLTPHRIYIGKGRGQDDPQSVRGIWPQPRQKFTTAS